tara:strand:- start:216 stop:971 length:756 start_codon:yes stop_codon:yes gene_type:complete
MDINKKQSMDPYIAEILGAFIGDGWIQSDQKALYVVGNLTEDKDYFDLFLAPLFSRCFNSVIPKKFPYWKVYGIGIYKKNIIENALNLGFQKGNKSLTVKIPQQYIKSKNKEIHKSIIRGIFDTDGCFWCERSRAKTSTIWKQTHRYHPELCITSCSKELLNQICKLLDNLDIESKISQKSKKGFKHGRNINDSFVLRIRKINEIKKWFKIIGTNNPKHKTKYLVWEKLGHLPPYTTLEERKLFLRGDYSF